MLPTEPIGSIPRPAALLDGIAEWGSEDRRLDPLYEAAISDTIRQFEDAGSPVVTDGFRIPFAAGHTRWMPRLTARPFRYQRYAGSRLT